MFGKIERYKFKKGDYGGCFNVVFIKEIKGE